MGGPGLLGFCTPQLSGPTQTGDLGLKRAGVENISSTSFWATVTASWLGMGYASTHLVNKSVTTRTYALPSGLGWGS